PMMGGLMLGSRQPAGQPLSPYLLKLQSRLFHLSAESPSLFPSVHRLARFLDARADFELSLTEQTNAAFAREACLSTVRQTVTEMKSASEFQAYCAFALKLGDEDLARDILEAWEHRYPEDISARRGRIQIETAAGAFGSALKRVDQFLASNPTDEWALKQR